jgi:hypothetical protein
MKVHRFLQALAGRRITETAVLVHAHALEEAEWQESTLKLS